MKYFTSSWVRKSLESLIYSLINIFFFSLFKIRNKGDAEIIKTIINYIESKIKIKIVGAENFLQNILMSKGILTETNITKNNLNSIELGVKTCLKIGNNDIGHMKFGTKRQ